MARNRFFVKTVSSEVLLTGDEFRHAKNVLRLTEGSEVTLIDGTGMEYSAIVGKVGKGEMILNVIEERKSDRDPEAEVLLLIGALKGDKTELVVQKAVELGVKEMIVFSSRYSAAYMNENKLERLNRVSREAAKQCMRGTVPQVKYANTLSEAIEAAEGYENKLFACEFIEKSERTLNDLKGSCALIVGSEGGFSREEFFHAKDCNFMGISLGRRILRAETAAISLLSVVMYELGELK